MDPDGPFPELYVKVSLHTALTLIRVSTWAWVGSVVYGDEVSDRL